MRNLIKQKNKIAKQTEQRAAGKNKEDRQKQNIVLSWNAKREHQNQQKKSGKPFGSTMQKVENFNSFSGGKKREQYQRAHYQCIKIYSEGGAPNLHVKCVKNSINSSNSRAKFSISKFVVGKARGKSLGWVWGICNVFSSFFLACRSVCLK